MSIVKNKKLIISLLALICVTYLITSVIFSFRDGLSLTVWTVEFWDVLFSGNLADFYDYTDLNLRGAPHGAVAGSFLPILPWCLWNFPIWLTHRSPIGTDVRGGGVQCLV